MKLKLNYLTHFYFNKKHYLLFFIFIVLFVTLSCQKIIINIPKCNYEINTILINTYKANGNSESIANANDTIKYYQDTMCIKLQAGLAYAYSNSSQCSNETIVDFIKDIHVVCTNNYLNYSQNDTIDSLFIVEYYNPNLVRESISKYLINKPTAEQPIKLKLIFAPTYINQNKFEVKIKIQKSNGVIQSFNLITPLLYLTP